VDLRAELTLWTGIWMGPMSTRYLLHILNGPQKTSQGGTQNYAVYKNGKKKNFSYQELNINHLVHGKYIY
jgi:hypothetical protein